MLKAIEVGQGASKPNLSEQAFRPKAKQAGFAELLQRFEKDWQSATVQREKLVKVLPAAVRPYAELQEIAQRLELQVQVVTKTAESVGNTIRRAQQIGG